MSAAATATLCTLCGLSAGRNPLDVRGRVFCCAGCSNVYTILLESGVIESGQDFRETEIFRESLRLGLISNADRSIPALPPDTDTREALYQVGGMWCTACGWLIEHALRTEPGVLSAEVMFASDLLKVRYSPRHMPPGRIEERVQRLGYRTVEFSGESARPGDGLMLKLGIAGFLYLNVSNLSWIFYVGFFESINDSVRASLPFLLLALATPAVFYSGWPILRIAFTGLRERVIRMESLLALGILAAYFLSAVQAFRGGDHFYFDTACAIVTLVLAGKVLERGAKEKTTRAISSLYRMMPKKARLLEGGRESFVAIEALEPGRVFLVKPGERVPADGVVARGNSTVDESMLTGESAARPKKPGDAVIGGSLNVEGALEVSATRTSGESALAQIVKSVEQALATRSPMERRVDHAARYFVPGVIALALATFAGCVAMNIAAGQALMRAISVLVIACPCALGIATPLAITAAIGAASRRGILVSDARVLETLRSVDVVLLDKTGTVTAQNEIVGVPEDHLQLLASLEVYSDHPVARAIVARNQLPLLTVIDVLTRPGLGIEGKVAGRRVRIGSARFLNAPQAGYQFGDGPTHPLSLASRIRPDAKQMVASLKARGVKTFLISGDSTEATEIVAAEIGTDGFEAEVLPDQKADRVKEYQRNGAVVAMIGDGVNDAPALAAADLGIAIGSGADLAMRAAPVVLMSDSLLKVEEIFDLARRTLRIVHQNLFWAFLYNTVGLALAIAGIVHPIVAAVAMVVSSLSVVVNSLRAARGDDAALNTSSNVRPNR